MLQHFDGVLLPGGGDVDPRCYGQEPTEESLYGIVAANDELDMAVATAALELDLPMLALCRGMQVLNIVLGGTLVQDIGNDEHWMREHSVKLVEGSIVADLVGDTHLDHCHSVHHQGIGELGAGSRADRVCRGWPAGGRRAADQVLGRRLAVAPRRHRHPPAPAAGDLRRARPQSGHCTDPE